MCEYFCLRLIRTNVAVDGHIGKKHQKNHDFTGFLGQRFERKMNENIHAICFYISICIIVYKNRQACASET